MRMSIGASYLPADWIFQILSGLLVAVIGGLILAGITSNLRSRPKGEEGREAGASRKEHTPVPTSSQVADRETKLGAGIEGLLKKPPVEMQLGHDLAIEAIRWRQPE